MLHAWTQSSLHLLLEHATTHVKRLQQRLKMLKQKKQLLEGRTHHITGSSRSPVIIVREMGSTLEVFLTSGLNKNFFLYEVISVLEEEAAQVVTANQSTVGDRIIYSICSQASRTYARSNQLMLSNFFIPFHRPRQSSLVLILLYSLTFVGC